MIDGDDAGHLAGVGDRQRYRLRYGSARNEKERENDCNAQGYEREPSRIAKLTATGAIVHRLDAIITPWSTFAPIRVLPSTPRSSLSSRALARAIVSQGAAETCRSA